MRRIVINTIIIIICLFINQHSVQASLDLTYNLNRGLLDRKYTLDDNTRLFIPEFNVKGIYVSGWSAGSNRINDLINLVDHTIINTMVIDIKDQDGYMSYISNVQTANKIGANKRKIRNVRALIKRLKSKGIHTIARVATFKDALLASKRPDLALKLYNKNINEMKTSTSWVDPADIEVWKYNVSLAREAAEIGFDEIQFDYIRYPALANEPIRAVLPGGKTETYYIKKFASYARDQLADLKKPLSIDVFGLTTTVKGDLGIGQNFKELSGIINIISPMVYPSHYADGTYGIDKPALEPYRLIHRSLNDAQQKVKGEQNVIIRPWLQDFSLKYKYTDKEIREQIRAVENLGIKEWLLWNPSGHYTIEALQNHHFK